jgi:hypothetical protein
VRFLYILDQVSDDRALATLDTPGAMCSIHDRRRADVTR